MTVKTPVNYAVEIPKELENSNQKFKKQLLMVPEIVLKDELYPITIMKGLYGKSTLSLIKDTLQLGDYDPHNVTQDGSQITPRTIETFLGSCINEFDPNRYVKTILDDVPVTKGKKASTKEIVTYTLQSKMIAIKDSISEVMFTAKRVPGGKNTADLFDGFNTIAEAEIALGNISEVNENLVTLTEAITVNNAYDQIRLVWKGLDKKLKARKKVYLMCDPEIYENYCDDYATQFNSTPYNTKYEQVVVQGTRQHLILCPLDNMAGSGYMYVAAPDVMTAAFGADPDNENVKVMIDHASTALLRSFVCTLFVGTQIMVIDKTFFKLVKLYVNG